MEDAYLLLQITFLAISLQIKLTAHQPKLSLVWATTFLSVLPPLNNSGEKGLDNFIDWALSQLQECDALRFRVVLLPTKQRGRRLLRAKPG